MSLLSRRAVVGGLPLAVLVCSPAIAQTPVISFALRIFIPSPAVFYLTSAFNGGDKVLLSGSVDLAKSGASSLSVTTRKFGETRRYDESATPKVPGKPDWYRSLSPGAKPTETGTAEVNDDTLRAQWDAPDGATHGLKIVVAGKNPLVSLAPAIDAEITIGLRRNGAGPEYRIEASHDGFPSYELLLGGKPVRIYDCVSAGESPLALGPPMDKSFSTGWLKL